MACPFIAARSAGNQGGGFDSRRIAIVQTTKNRLWGRLFARGSGGGGGALRVGVHANQSLRSNTMDEWDRPFIAARSAGNQGGGFDSRRIAIVQATKNRLWGRLFARGSGGGGGYRIYISTYCLIEKNKFTYCRHAPKSAPDCFVCDGLLNAQKMPC